MFECIQNLGGCLDKFLIFELDEGISELLPSAEELFESFYS